MKKQLRGIALLLVGIQLILVAMIDPWIPVIGDVGRVLIPLLAFAVSVAGLVMVFTGRSDS